MDRALGSWIARRESGRVKKNTVQTLNSADFLWIACTLFPILLVAFLLPVHPNDYWWYVRLGSDIARSGAIPTVDTLSSSQTGEPFVLHAWMAARIFWELHRLGGMTATVLAAGVAIGAFYLFIWFTCRIAGAGPQLASALTLLAALAGSNNWGVRPQLFTYPLFGVVLYTLWRWQEGSNRSLWVLPAAGLLWANLHGSFPLFFLLCGAGIVAGAGDRKRLGIAMAGGFAATLASPRFLGVWTYAFDLFRNPAVRQFSREWYPPVNSGWQAAIFFGWLLVFPLLVACSPRKLAWLHWFWFLGLGWMALGSVRNEIWFLALLAPLCAGLISAWLAEKVTMKIQQVRPALNFLAGILLILLPFAGLPGIRERWWSTPPPVLSQATPVAAARWLDAHPELPGPVWTEPGFASYLAFATPERKVWLDARFELYPVEQWERYIEISEAAPGWENYLEAEEVELVMVNTVEQPRLLASIESSPGWCELYRDTTAAVFSKDRHLAP
jgi:hypothetical protein